MLTFIAVLLSIGSWFFGGFTFMTLWAWFVAPTFGIAVLTYAQALGLSLVLKFIKPKNINIDKDGSVEVLISTSIVFYAFYGLLIGLGAIIKLFI